MLREHINDIMSRWSPKERRGSTYDPTLFVETSDQARKLIGHLEAELAKARKERNFELVNEISNNLARVESLSRQFFRWEKNRERSLELEEMREIKKLPLGL